MKFPRGCIFCRQTVIWFVYIAGLLVSPIESNPKVNPDPAAQVYSEDMPSKEKISNPFAPVTGLIGQMKDRHPQSKHGSVALIGYRLAGIVSAKEKNVAVLQLPNKSFHTIEPGETFNEMTVLSIGRQEVVLQNPLGNHRLFVSE